MIGITATIVTVLGVFSIFAVSPLSKGGLKAGSVVHFLSATWHIFSPPLTAQIACQRIASDETLRAFVIDTGDAVFLFDDDMDAQLKEIRSRAQRLQSLDYLMEPMPVGPQRTNFVNQSDEQFTWLVKQLDGLVDTFKPFMKLKLGK
jgi:hypothetical protein